MKRRPSIRLFASTVAIVAVGSVVLADWNEGLAAFNSGDFPEAADHFEEMTRTNPTWSGGYYMLGRCQSELGQGPDAIVNLRKAYSLDTSDSNIIIALSRELVSERDFSQVLDILTTRTIGQLPPGRKTEATILLASAMLGAGEAPEAVEILETRLIEERTNPTLFRLLGQAQELNGDTEGAFRSFSEAFKIKTEERSGKAATQTALSLAAAAAETDTKAQWYRQAADIGSRLATAFPKEEYDLLAGRTALGAEDFRTAEYWFNAAASKNEAAPETRYLLGRSLVGQGRDDDAYKAFSAALALGPDDQLARRIHGRMGRISACRLNLETAADHYRAAGKDDRAQEIQGLATQFAGALDQLEKLQAAVTELQQMEQQLKELGDDQGVAAMRERAAGEQSKIDEIEKNLEAVRAALCG